ncbi:MAG TPA: type I methionyl aminopeptidase [Flavobacteriales bacterium]|jgi:methionyl aminopeptidase|nr:type I methionyl aminopeptidase [Flavobacteriales bacterium]
MVYLKTEEEIELVRISSLLVGKTHGVLAPHIVPGVVPEELDRIAEEFIRDNGATPSFFGYNGFPKSICVSINEEVVHGIPSKEPLKNGDIVSVDIGVYKNGFHGDSAYTYEVGEVDEEVHLLLERTKESLMRGIKAAKAGNRIGDIGHAIQSYVEDFGYGVVRELVGHGLGRDLHESPEVPNYGTQGRGKKLVEGMVLAIEPMVNLGVREIRQLRDGWTIVTRDGKPSAHFEHDVVIRKDGAEVLSTFEFVEKELVKS